MRRTTMGLLAGIAAGSLLLAACGDDGGDGDGTSGSTSSPQAEGTVGVILPDAATSPRWEANDRPALRSSLEALGVKADIQNANGDVAKFGTICDSMINAGVKVLMIVNLDSESGTACLKKAQAAGIPTIDYDRLTLGGGASYYVSFDNVQVGKLMGEGLKTCLDQAGKTSAANIVYINGAPTDNNAALFKAGYVSALKPLIDAGTYKLVGDQTGNWDATQAGTTFEQMYTQNGGKIDGAVSANDTMAGGIIAVLKRNGVNGKVPVTGQDATLEGLQSILVGDQCMTVYKPIPVEAEAAAKLAQALMTGADAKDIAKGIVKDTVLNKDVPSALETPQSIFKDSVKNVIADGYWTKEQVCTAQYAQACTAAGIQ